MKKVHYTFQARRDLNEIAERIAIANLDAAIRFCAAVENASAKLAEMPGMGPSRELNNPMLADLRSWPINAFRNYLIFYRPTGYGIEIVRILHGAQDIESIFGP